MSKQTTIKEDTASTSVEMVKCRILKPEYSLTEPVGSIIELNRSLFDTLELWEFVEAVGDDK